MTFRPEHQHLAAPYLAACRCCAGKGQRGASQGRQGWPLSPAWRLAIPRLHCPACSALPRCACRAQLLALAKLLMRSASAVCRRQDMLPVKQLVATNYEQVRALACHCRRLHRPRRCRASWQ